MGDMLSLLSLHAMFISLQTASVLEPSDTALLNAGLIRHHVNLSVEWQSPIQPIEYH